MADKVDFGPRIGADPEFFIIKLKNETLKKNTIVPVFGLMGGDKENPRVIEPERVLGANAKQWKYQGFFGIQEDNVALELNLPATGRLDHFIHYWQQFQTYLNEQELKPRGMMLSWNSRHKFKGPQLENPRALQIGCSPDFHAYSPEATRKREPFEARVLGDLRFTGGHIHVQYNFNNVPQDVFAKFMDIIYLQFLAKDRQQERRQFYGLAGLYRPTSYGIEYRTPSNFWLNPSFYSPGFMENFLDGILQLATKTLDETTTEELKETYKQVPWDDVEKSINGEDIKLGKEIIDHCRHFFPVSLLGNWLV